VKHLHFHGPKGHFFEVPGFFKIGSGESGELSDHMAEAVVNANPDAPLTVTDKPKPGHDADAEAESQPEAHEGEGQPTAPDSQEE